MAILIWNLQDLADVINNCQKNKYDVIMFIEGNRGIGKSTLAYKICVRSESPFIPEKDIVFSRDDVLKQIAKKKFGIIFADEMINVAYKRDFYLEDQKTLIKMLNMYRDSCNIFIGCVPLFSKLDTDLRDLVKIRISVVRRGLALIHTQIPTIYSTDKWDLRNNQKIESKWSRKGYVKPRYTQLTTVRGILKFGDLTEKQRIKYERIKEEKRNRLFEIAQGEPDKYSSDENIIKKLLDKNLTKKTLIDFCFITNQQYATVRNRLNSRLKEMGYIETLKDLLQEEKLEKIKKKFHI